MISSDRYFQRRLEVLSDQAMPGFERKHLGGWVMRAGIGATGRANSAWPDGDPGVELSAAVDMTENWYTERGLNTGFQLFDDHPAALRETLFERSYVQVPGALVMWAPIDKIMLDVEEPTDWSLKMTSVIDPQLAQMVDDPGRVSEISMPEPEPRFVAALDRTGQLLGGGKSVLLDDSLGIFAMLTAESARRQGIARGVLTHLITDGAANGARWAWLQVAKANQAAISLYQGVGFEAAHSYVYMFAPIS